MNQEKYAHIILYAEDFNQDVWEQYCDIADVPYYAKSITIKFDKDTVDYEDGEEEILEEEEEE